MKRVTNAILALLLAAAAVLCAGCDDKDKDKDTDTDSTSDTVYTDEYVFGQDAQESFISYINSSDLYGGSYAESEDSYYFLNTNNSLIYVIDKSTHACQVLCAKSDCLHEKESDPTSCDAYIKAKSIAYYQEKIYYNQTETLLDEDGNYYDVYELCRMNLDGTTRETVFSSEDYYIYNIKVHRGYIYFQATKKSEGTIDLFDSAYYRIAVDGGEVNEIMPLYDYYEQSINLFDIRFSGNTIVFAFDTTVQVSTTDTADDENSVYRDYSILYTYDINTGKLTNISESLEINNASTWFTIFNEKIIYSVGPVVYECNMDGSNETQVLDFSQGELADYMYFNTFTTDGENLIISVSETELGLPYKLIFCDEEYNTSVYQLSRDFQAVAGCDSDVLIVYNEENLTLELYDKSELSEDTVAEPVVLYQFTE